MDINSIMSMYEVLGGLDFTIFAVVVLAIITCFALTLIIEGILKWHTITNDSKLVLFIMLMLAGAGGLCANALLMEGNKFRTMKATLVPETKIELWASPIKFDKYDLYFIPENEIPYYIISKPTNSKDFNIKLYISPNNYIVYKGSK